MNWILASILMFISSVALYLFVRKAALLKISSQYNNLAMFLVPLLVFFPMGIISQQNFLISPYHLLLISFVAIVFAYLGNLFSLISIQNAPNPGYSLVISKSYVVFTTIVSVIFFNSEISLKKIVAILLIVLFSGLIMLSQKSMKHTATINGFL